MSDKRETFVRDEAAVMTMWVTGANGFIGRYLVRSLADRGHAVHGIGHGAIAEDERRRLGLGHWLNGEIDFANLDSLASRSGLPSTLFHLAGGSSVGLSFENPYEDFARTVGSTARLLEWLRLSAPQCGLIVASSAAVYGTGHTRPISEDTELQPISPYGQHKLMMEQLCRSYAVTYCVRTKVVRFFSVYGAQLRKQLLWDICCRLQKGEQTLALGGTGGELRDWVEVRDAARLFVQVAETPQVETYQVLNGGSGIGTSVADIAKLLLKEWGGNTVLQFSGAARSGDPFSLVADDTRLRRLSFAQQIPLSQGIADYVSWFKDQARR
jgi:UDP-glucose 4-epimerase